MPDTPNIEVRETGSADLDNVSSLWADGDVMKFVGFPGGLHYSRERMARWYERVAASRPERNHYSVFADGRYCGESFYSIDHASGAAALDIKLFPFARGKGVATAALRHAIHEAFAQGARKVWVNPRRENEKALALYERVGMTRKPLPPALQDADYPDVVYYELERE